MYNARYRLVPIPKGVAVIVPHDVDRLELGRIKLMLPFVRSVGGWTFVSTATQWGFKGALSRQERNDGVIYVAHFSRRSREETRRSLLALFVALRSQFVDDPRAPSVSFLGYSFRTVRLTIEVARVVCQFTHDDAERIVASMNDALREMKDRPEGCAFEIVDGAPHFVVPHGYLRRKNDAPKEVILEGHVMTASQEFALLRGLAQMQAIAEQRSAAP